MSLLAPFVYPPRPHERRHNPAGYANYQDYKPWLRDGFTFRCVYCLERETWYPDQASSFSADHVVPKSEDPSRICDYTNLVYACTRCNSLKARLRLLDPSAVSFGEHLMMDDGGILHSTSNDGEFLVRILHLNEHPALTVRKFHLEVFALRKEFPDHPKVQSLFLQSFGYPEDLPDLISLMPPAGNSLDPNKHFCFRARRDQGLLEQVY